MDLWGHVITFNIYLVEYNNVFNGIYLVCYYQFRFLLYHLFSEWMGLLYLPCSPHSYQVFFSAIYIFTWPILLILHDLPPFICIEFLIQTSTVVKKITKNKVNEISQIFYYRLQVCIMIRQSYMLIRYLLYLLENCP